jgi:signal transduction histidine kinase
MSSYKILEEVLNWARIQTNQVSIKSEEINLKVLIDIIVANQIPIAETKNISISNSLNDNTIVNSDSNIVSTVLRNLISNAIKYSYPNGEIQVSVLKKGDFYEISVKDNGVGMSEEVRVSLLNSTHSQSTLGTANEKGSGLGLIICKELISKIGGQIYIEPNLDGGTNFKFTIPYTM